MSPRRTPDHGEIIIHDDVLARGFTQGPLAIERCGELSVGARFMYRVLLFYHWQGRGWPGREAVAQEWGVSPSSVYRWMRDLQAGNLVRAERASYAAPNTYHLLLLREATVPLKLRRGRLRERQKPPQGEAEAASGRGALTSLDSVLDLESEVDSKIAGAVERLLALAPEESPASLATCLKGFPIQHV